MGETVKTVGDRPAAPVTLLKQGVNEIGTGMKWYYSVRVFTQESSGGPK